MLCPVATFSCLPLVLQCGAVLRFDLPPPGGEMDGIQNFYFAKWPNTNSHLWPFSILLHPEKTNQRTEEDANKISLNLWASPSWWCSYDFWMFQHIFSSLWFFWGYMGGYWQYYTNTVFTAQQSLDPDLEFNVGGIGVNANKKARTGLLQKLNDSV